jgi:hypothetical protein
MLVRRGCGSRCRPRAPPRSLRTAPPRRPRPGAQPPGPGRPAGWRERQTARRRPAWPPAACAALARPRRAADAADAHILGAPSSHRGLAPEQCSCRAGRDRWPRASPDPGRPAGGLGHSAGVMLLSIARPRPAFAPMASPGRPGRLVLKPSAPRRKAVALAGAVANVVVLGAVLLMTVLVDRRPAASLGFGLGARDAAVLAGYWR